MSDRRILVIGYGAIAADLVADLGADGATVCGVFLRPGSASRDKVPGGITVCETIEEIAAFGPDLVVEAARPRSGARNRARVPCARLAGSHRLHRGTA